MALRAISRSQAACARNQKPSDKPKNLESLKSVSAVIALLPKTMSPIRCAGTPIALASRYLDISIGTRNSSQSISPGVTGLSFLAILSLTCDSPLAELRLDRLPSSESKFATAHLLECCESHSSFLAVSLGGFLGELASRSDCPQFPTVVVFDEYCFL